MFSLKKLVIMACVISTLAVLAITAGTAFAGVLNGTPAGPVACPALAPVASTPAGAAYGVLCG